MITLIVVSLVGLVLGADFVYSRSVAAHGERWELEQSRGADGVRAGSESFTRGNGSVALLMVHGFGSSPAVFHRWAEELAARGYTCRAIRLPGFGEPLMDARLATADDWRRVLDEEIAALRRTHASVWLVGHSMGGALCTEAALRRADEVDGVLLLAPLCEVSRRRSLGLPPERIFDMHRILPFTDTFETCFPVAADDPEVARLEERDRFVPLNIYEGMFEVMRAGRAAAPQLHQPVWVVAARNDRVVDFDAAKELADTLSHPASAFLAVEPAGHVLPLDTGWRELCHEADAFVRGSFAP